MKSTLGRLKCCNVDAIIPDWVTEGFDRWTISGVGGGSSVG